MNRVQLIIAAAIVVVLFGGVLVFGRNNSPQITPAPTPEAPTVTPTSEPSPTATASATPTPPGQRPSGPAATPTINTKAKSATIKTSKGNIVLELYPNDAPKTVANFVTKAKEGFYDNLTFHRVEDWVIQGGDPTGTGADGEEMPTEINSKPFVLGSLGVARKGDIRVSNDAQFFITKQNASWLNSQYTNFGIVTKGIEVVNKIEKGDKILGITVE